MRLNDEEAEAEGAAIVDFFERSLPAVQDASLALQQATGTVAVWRFPPYLPPIEHDQGNTAIVVPTIVVDGPGENRAAIPQRPPTSNSQRPSNAPIFVDLSLAQKIADWLKDPSTRLVQSVPIQLALGNENQTSIDYTLNQVDKIQLSRISIATHSSPSDWFIIEAQKVHLGESTNQNETPYSWLMAFPVSAVTTSKTFPSLPYAQIDPARGTVMDTIWKLGGQGHLPSFQTSGAQPEGLDEFMNACATGKAMIQMRSWGAMF